MRPKVILHAAVSADGRIDHFPVNLPLFYSLAGRWEEDITLAGSDTVLAMPQNFPSENAESMQPSVSDAQDARPLLVIADSRGRVRSWQALRRAPYWRDVMALCSQGTPPEYLSYLRDCHVPYIIAGENRVDFAVAVGELGNRFGAGSIRVESGGTLNGLLLRAGLVDEVSLLIHPFMVGGTSPRSVFRAPDLLSDQGAISLEPIGFEVIDGGIIWARYRISQ